MNASFVRTSTKVGPRYNQNGGLMRGRRPMVPAIEMIVRIQETGVVGTIIIPKGMDFMIEYDYDADQGIEVLNLNETILGRIHIYNKSDEQFSLPEKKLILSGYQLPQPIVFLRPTKVSKRRARAAYIEDNSYDMFLTDYDYNSDDDY